MIDREKVIKGLMVCVDRIPGEYSCNGCPYEIDGNECEINMTKDAIVLLKEQEPISPSCDMDGRYLVCGNCGKKIGKSTNYCTKCGRAVKWE